MLYAPFVLFDLSHYSCVCFFVGSFSAVLFYYLDNVRVFLLGLFSALISFEFFVVIIEYNHIPPIFGLETFWIEWLI